MRKGENHPQQISRPYEGWRTSRYPTTREINLIKYGRGIPAQPDREQTHHGRPLRDHRVSL